MNNKYKLITIFILVFSCFYITFGYAAYSQELIINNISATFRQPLDVRVSDFYLSNSENGAFSENDSFNGKLIFSDVTIPENSSVTYTVEFSNYSNHMAYLIDIKGVPENLKYEIDVEKTNKYKLRDLMFDSEYQNRQITLTFSYKENGYDQSNFQYNLNVEFYFESSYNVVFNIDTNSLPLDYQQVEYLESTGTQYINTNYLPNNLTNIESQFMYNDLSELTSLFGVREVNGTKKQFLISTTPEKVLWIVNGINNKAIENIIVETNQKYTVKITPTAAYWNTEKILDMNSELAAIEKKPMYLFGRNTSDGFSTPLKGKIYYLKIIENDKLVRNFIPCYRKIDKVSGMYDTVENIFYENAGTGNFITGADMYVLKHQTILLGQNEKLNKNEFSKENYIFTGWNTKPDGTGTYYADESVVYNLVDADEIINLYAQWRPYQLIVKLNPNGGMGIISDIKIPYLTSMNLPKNTYENLGYIFTGWNTKPDGTGIKYEDESQIYNSNKTDGIILNLYAQWLSFVPLEYQVVEYLESNGKQYIDTQYYPNSTTSVESKFMFNEIKDTSSPFGVREVNQTQRQFLISVTNNNVLWIVNGINNLSFNNLSIVNNKDYTIKVTPTEAFWNGNKISDLNAEKAKIQERSMYMFGRNTMTGFANPLYGKIYYLKIYENADLTKYFVPCYRKSDNIAGMYELIGNKFYTNNGTGEFTVGADVNTKNM